MSLALTLSHAPEKMRPVLPGVIVAAALALAAGWIAGGLGEPLSRNPVLVAMLFGLMIGSSFACPDALRPGLDFTKRYLLRLAVVLVGFRITTRLFLDLGFMPLAVAAIELILVLTLLYAIARKLFRLDAEIALLVAVGSAVCGAAAILSMAALVRARDQSAGIAIALITLSGTVALLAYPVMFLSGWLPHLDDRLYGVFVGASIFELAQVYGASFAISDGALNTATLVKLSKVLMLVPLLLAASLVFRSRNKAQEAAPIPFPWFIVAFIGVVMLNSEITLNPQLRRVILDVDQFLFLMVMIALGITTRVSRLGEAGGAWRLVGVGLVGLVLSAALAYGALLPFSSTFRTASPSSSHSAMLGSHGGRLFASVGCAKCHVPALEGVNGEVRLYSDLLLHDMGPALDDKIVQGDAIGAEWRTTPLVGIRLRQRYLHDGRANTLRDAVFAHGGTTQIVRDRFFDLDETDRQAILDFVAKL
ncbi:MULTISPECIES: putative sulfate exporter family transporter [unclassified Mesorhizobium]|uniref:putative sulfate exporter family transporter n=1 Tax=unclassified Mesorhizobium TaxID=325217 RepID=UPI000F756558|nr:MULTISPECIES: putative sulfate exporter family transporter [unclassified Mesorhizobium]AZO64218.1 putative sulfate exporter family transporter [Mesorhizobium sp. M6A.T.Cr.TU.016.01.1.1]RWP56343.1 MAG: putative sulfate exporter family transporter [Mesorhizobium sp.]RWQ62132.1 MAG: putative sulfate exporter family transporter [Mesorhizobium sp.]RWQ82082.1 MAG: putative sulfate exporter family transporter [Mesorhizobium sp.]